jgi:DNA-binding CsgD family transcriptional regulator
MIFDTEHRKQNLTLPQLTIHLDVETCFMLAEVFKELGEGLHLAKRRFKGKKEWTVHTLPHNLELKKEKLASVAKRLKELKEPPSNKAASILRTEFNETYDGMMFLISAVRQEQKEKALKERDAKIWKMDEEGLTAAVIAKSLKLAVGTVRNILSRLRKDAARRADAKATAA